jgi:nucleotide-binding universal stress UspA family protein
MRILAGIDLAAQGHDWLLARAVAFTAAARGTLDLVYVHDDPSQLAALEAMFQAVPPALRGVATIRPGNPLDELIKLSGEVDALVIGPREPGGLERYLQGAMAVRVLRRAQCPVFVPRTDRFGQRKPRILVGIDLTSGRMRYAMRTTAAIAQAVDAEAVDATYAMPRTLPAIRRPELRAAATTEWAQQHEHERLQLERLLQAVDPFRRGIATVGHGEPEDLLVAESRHYDLTVVGNRNRPGLPGMLLGSVAAHVTRNALSDVLILPTGAQPEDPPEHSP